MTEVGVRAFKADVSGYLQRASQGERVRVTSHGKPLVELVPVVEASDDPNSVEAQMQRLRDSGAVTPRRSDTRRLPKRRYRAVGSGSLSDDIVAERNRERGER